MSSHLEDLNWRYATKKFDPTKKLSDAQVTGLLETLRLAPSSFGLQPWRFILVTDPALRKTLRPLSWNQPQITDASHLVVLCSIKQMNSDYVKRYIQILAKVRGVTVESMKDYEERMTNFLKSLTPESLSQWRKEQVYIALGFLLAECARERVDSCPLGGFDHPKVDEALKLEQMGLESVVMCPLGYRAADDAYALAKKVRYCAEEVILKI